MTRLTQVCGLLFAIAVFCDRAHSAPLFEGINIERKINIDFKPLKFRPLTFIREKWGPFGRFGKKHTIERRDLDDMNVIDKDDIELVGAAGRTIPVVEKLDEPLLVPVYRPPVKPVLPPSGQDLFTAISPAIPSNPYFTPAEKPVESAPEPEAPVPVIEVKPVDVPLFVPAEVVEQSSPPPTAAVDPPAPPPPPPTRPGILSFFGELFSELMARFIARARASFSQLSLPPVQQ